MNDVKYPELLPCPFCGGIDLVVLRGMTESFVQCNGCEASASFAPEDAVAIAAWNTRADTTCALRGAQKESGWRPIETAPQDGTPILAWNAEYGARETRSITYTPGSPGFAEGLTDRWWQWDEPKNNWSLKWQPTHWMPLPEPPNA